MNIDRRIYIGVLVAKELAENGDTSKSARGIAEKLGLPEIAVRQTLVRLRKTGSSRRKRGAREVIAWQNPRKRSPFPCCSGP